MRSKKERESKSMRKTVAEHADTHLSGIFCSGVAM